MELSEAIIKSIEIIRNNNQENDDVIMQKLAELGIEKDLANHLATFIPIAYCRAFLDGSGVTFVDYYLYFDEKGSTSKPRWLTDEPVFLEALKIAEGELKGGANGERYFSIAGRSGEFRAINDLLNRGSKFEDIVMSPMHIHNPNFFLNNL
jgi:hypothetical protein